MIEFRNVSVKFDQGDDVITAVDDVNLKIDKGEVFGIVGFSGAGKSTLVRVINYLQPPTDGQVLIDGVDLGGLNAKELRTKRKKIGMIFQHFNLLEARTVEENIAFVLKHSDLTKEEKAKKVASLIELVGLVERKEAYPSQLSGGQKQRVAIARALANDPEILLSDEATSALDPKTTKSILSLLKKVNEELGITIVVITHEMNVIKEIATRVAVMENGKVVESGDLLQIFTNPNQELTRDFVNSANNEEESLQKIYETGIVRELEEDQYLASLSYVGKSSEQPLIAHLFSEYQVETNILTGNIELIQGIPFGNLFVIFKGENEKIAASNRFLATRGVQVKLILRGKTEEAQKFLESEVR
jgi:D-methionine transport system ATP-binding protein